MSSRLFTEVREKRGLCYTVYATYHTLRDRASVLCYAGTSAERAQETLDVTLAELVRLAEGIEPNELARLKARIKSRLIMQQESSSSRSSVDRPRLVSPGPRAHAGRSRPLVDALTCEASTPIWPRIRRDDFTIVTLGQATQCSRWRCPLEFRKHQARQRPGRSSPSATTRPIRRPWASSCRPAPATRRDDVAGVSHFLEHMMFKGTPTRTRRRREPRVRRDGGPLQRLHQRRDTVYYAAVLPEYQTAGRRAAGRHPPARRCARKISTPRSR